MKKLMTLRLNHMVLTMLAAALVLVIAPATASALQLLNSADTYGNNLQPDTNFGGLDFVNTKDFGAGPNRKAYLKWDLSSIITPVTTATLRLQAAIDGLTGTGLSGDVYLLNDSDVGESWGELTLTWNNAPANITGSGVLFDGARSTFVGNIAVPDPRTVGDYWTMSSPALIDAINNDTDDSLTLMMATAVTGPTGQTFGSKEDTDGNPAQGWTTPFDGATLFLDELPPPPAPDPPPGLGRGHRILLQKGLQIQAQTFITKIPAPGFDQTTWANSDFTTINFQFDSDAQGTPAILAAAPADQQWARIRGSFHLNPGELAYEANLVSVQHLDDDLDLSDPGDFGTAITTLADLRSRHPDALSFTNAVGSDNEKRAYMAAAEPDMLMSSTYVWNHIPQPGGSPTFLYGQMQQRRLMGLRGNDWSGNRPIPYGRYMQMYVLEDDPMSESEINLEYFSSWAFGYKFVSAFTYNSAFDDPSLLPPNMFNGVGDDNRTVSFDQVAEANRQSANLGPALVRLISTDLRMKMGQNSGGSNALPPSVSAWDSAADPYITTISATNLGTKNNGLEGDVIIGYFNVLLESFDGPDDSDEIYFMIVNGLTDSDGSAAETQQEIRVDFDFLSSGITGLQRLSRDTGLVEDVTLMSDGGSLFHLDLILDGGTGDLFKFNTGADFVLESGRTWANAVSSDWSANANWDGGVAPNANDVSVIFASAITSPGTVFTNSAVTVESIQFGELDDNGATQSYVIAGQGSVNLESSISNASIDVIDGTHQFQAVVNLASSTDVSVAASSSLAFNNVLNLNGNTLTKTGAGTLSINSQLSGPAGLVTASAGVVDGSGTIGGDLTNSGATVAPGNSPGKLTVAGDYLQTAGSLEIEINGTSDDDVSGNREFDLLSVGGSLTISGGSLDIVMGFTPTARQYVRYFGLCFDQLGGRNAQSRYTRRQYALG